MLIDPRVASGLRDLTPNLAKPRERLTDNLREVFHLFGFQTIQTPHIERKEVLTGKGAGSEEVLRQIFDVTNTGGTPGELALRFDHTVPLARFVSAHINELGLPFKRYAIGSVFRGERPAKGRFREFTQCDFDIVGTESLVADAEIILLMYSALKHANVPPFKIWLNHRGILEGLLIKASASDRGPAVLRSLDKMAKIGRDKVLAELTNTEKGVGLEQSQAELIVDFVTLGRGGPEVLDYAEQQLGDIAVAHNAITAMKSLVKLLTEANYNPDFLGIDTGLARGLDYYTGVVLETTVNGWEKFGSIGSGGRYDNLTSLFSQRKLPGVGASIGLDRLIALLEESGDLEKSTSPEGVLVGYFPGIPFEVPFKIAAGLRQSGITAECYPDAIPIGKQMAYGGSRGYRLGLILGPDELEQGVFHLRDLTNRKEFKNFQLSQVNEIVASVNAEIKAGNTEITAGVESLKISPDQTGSDLSQSRTEN